MIKIHDIVHSILLSDEEALSAVSNGYMNFSQYANRIQKEVEQKTMKNVGVPGIVVALSRIAKNIENKNPLVQDVQIKNITTKYRFKNEAKTL